MNIKKSTIEKEQGILNAILQYLTLRNVFHYRNNVIGFQDSRGHFYRSGVPGAPDIIAVIGGCYVGIEVKRINGYQSDHQKRFEKQLNDAGGRYILVHSVDELHEKVGKELSHSP